QRALEQELLAEDVALRRVPIGLLGRLDREQLLAVVPLVQRLGLVEALVALEADQRAVEVARERLRQLRLADAGRPLDEDRLAQAGGQVRDERRRLAGQVPDGLEAIGDVLDRCGFRLHGSGDDREAWCSGSCTPSSTTRTPRSGPAPRRSSCSW